MMNCASEIDGVVTVITFHRGRRNSTSEIDVINTLAAVNLACVLSGHGQNVVALVKADESIADGARKGDVVIACATNHLDGVERVSSSDCVSSLQTIDQEVAVDQRK